MSGGQRGQAAAAAYRNAAETTAPARQIVMLYDGAIRHLRLAQAAILGRQVEARHTLVMRAYKVIGALQGCLDRERGGEVAVLLDRYYDYLLHRMTLIDVRNDPAICEEVVARLGEMRASWASIADGPGAPARAPGPAPARLAV